MPISTEQLTAIDLLFEDSELIRMSGYHFDAETVEIGVNELKLGIIAIIKGEDAAPSYLDVVKYLQYRPNKRGRIIVRPHGEIDEITVGVFLDDCSRICFTDYHRNIQDMYNVDIISID